MYHDFEITFDKPTHFNSEGKLVVNGNDSARLQSEYRYARAKLEPGHTYNDWLYEQLKDAPTL